MNDMTVPDTQMYFTAAELAFIAFRFGYKGLPHTKRGVNAFAVRRGWNEQAAHLCRKREGQTGGGGLEYNICLIPDLQSMLVAERMLTARGARRVVAQVRDSAVDLSRTGAGPADTAKARVEIMAAIYRYAAQKSRKVSQGITDFLKAQDEHLAWLEAAEGRDRGAFLTSAQARLLQTGSPLLRQDLFWLNEAVLAKAHGRPRKDRQFQRISRSSLYGWLKGYETGGIETLVPVPTKVEQQIPEDFRRFMGFYARPAKPSIEAAHKKYLDDTPAGVQPLSIEQVRHILRNKLDHVQRNKGRQGPLAMRAHMAYVSRDTSDILPSTIYTGDGHTFDARIADPRSRQPMRPELTTIIDVTTRRVTGWAVSRKENVIAVTEAMRNACIDVAVPAVVYFDNGGGYKNKRFDDAGTGLMARLDITKVHALPYGSQAKGNIERSHQSIWIPLAREFPTYLGADMDKEARAKVDRQIKADLKEKGHSKLLMPWEEFREVCQQRIDEYNDTPHSALPRFEDPVSGRIRHMSPNECWQSHVEQGFEPVLVDPFAADDLFRPYKKRMVNRCLIELHTNEYFSLDLNPYHEQEVFVGYDDNQADRVWIREIDPKTRGVGRLICVAAFGGNKVDYMPRTFLAQAMDRREKGRLKRNDVQRQLIEAERLAPYLIDHQSEDVADFIDRAPALDPVPVSLAVDNTVEAAAVKPAAPRRRVFQSDAELAAWALQNPDQLSANQIAVLRGCLSKFSLEEGLRLSGIDTEALRTLLRAVAA